MASATFTASTSLTSTSLPNPERGFHLATGGDATGEGLLASTSKFQSELNIIKGATYNLRLAHPHTLLSKTASLTSTQLTQMDTNLAALRTSGMKAMLIFAYDFSGATNPDPGLSQMQTHATQIKPHLATYRDVIHAVEMGFIGKYGEWHSSGTSGMDSQANKTAVKDMVLDMVPREIPIACRLSCFAQDFWYTSAQSSAGMYSGSDQSRVGSHNDAYMATSNDKATYPGTATVIDYTYTKSQTQQRIYQQQASEYVIFCGETDNGSAMRLATNGGLDGSNQSGGILNEGPRNHLVNLNRTWYGAFVDNAPTGSWDTEGKRTLVGNMMGYVIQLDSISHNDSVARGATLTITVTLRNIGWSRCHRERRLRVVLAKSAQTDITALSNQQLRQLPSQGTSSVTFQVSVAIAAGAATGSWDMHIDFPDYYTNLTARAFKIRPANNNSGGQTWDDTNGRFATGTTVTVT
jgi:hypothetical protein